MNRRTGEIIWKTPGEPAGYSSFIAGNDRVLIVTVESQLLLIEANAESYAPKSQLSLFDAVKTEVWSHPAILPGRLYIRNSSEISCLLLD